MTYQCITNTCVCIGGTARIEGDDNCLATHLDECDGIYDAWKDPNASAF